MSGYTPSGDDYAITRGELLRIRGEGFGPTEPNSDVTPDPFAGFKHGRKATYEAGCRCTECRRNYRNRNRPGKSASRVSGKAGILRPPT